MYFLICFFKRIFMAKKKNETNAVPMEQELVEVSVPLSTISNKVNLNSLSIQELIYIEQATRIVCQKYENTVKNYDGSFKQNGDDYNNFKKFNTLRNKVISKLEEKLEEFI